MAMYCTVAPLPVGASQQAYGVCLHLRAATSTTYISAQSSANSVTTAPVAITRLRCHLLRERTVPSSAILSYAASSSCRAATRSSLMWTMLRCACARRALARVFLCCSVHSQPI